MGTRLCEILVITAVYHIKTIIVTSLTVIVPAISMLSWRDAPISVQVSLPAGPSPQANA